MAEKKGGHLSLKHTHVHHLFFNDYVSIVVREVDILCDVGDSAKLHDHSRGHSRPATGHCGSPGEA